MLTILQAGALSPRLEAVLRFALEGIAYRIAEKPEALLSQERVLFAAALPKSGVNEALHRTIGWLRLHGDALRGTVAGVCIDGESELYTKALGRTLVLAANGAGCAFPGRPLTEGTGSLHNYRVQASITGRTLEETYAREAAALVYRIVEFQPEPRATAKLLVLHASSHATSNTLALWSMVRDRLPARIQVREIALRNGEVADCVGCPYTTCLHFSEQGKCFYGGVMVQEVYPAVTECDGLLLLCPNYNDALGANLSAFINRLTALFRRMPFFEKQLFGIVVSGYSGGDIVAEQLISSLSMNKSFALPAGFCMLETANDRGEIAAVPGIQERAAAFAARIEQALLRG